MTYKNKFQIKAETFIDNVIEKSRKSYDVLMMDLESKIEDWSFEYRKLSYINVFELTDEEHERKFYLDYLISYGKRLVIQRKLVNQRKIYQNEKVCKCCGK
jgi:hypothetical protein